MRSAAIFWVLLPWSAAPLYADSGSQCVEAGALGTEAGLCSSGASDEARDRCDAYITKTFAACIAEAARAYADFSNGETEAEQDSAILRFQVALNEFRKMQSLAENPATDPDARRRLKRVQDAMLDLEKNKEKIEVATGKDLDPLPPPPPPVPPPAPQAPVFDEVRSGKARIKVMDRLASRAETAPKTKPRARPAPVPARSAVADTPPLPIAQPAPAPLPAPAPDPGPSGGFQPDPALSAAALAGLILALLIRRRRR